MSQFIQIHMLTAYPPACLNRDDLNRPKTARMGGVQRLRISSQCLKRTWRTSELFQEAMAGHVGTRTKEMGVAVYESLTQGWPLDVVLQCRLQKTPLPTEQPPLKPVEDDKKAREWSETIAGRFGKRKTEKGLELETEQLVHFAPSEVRRIAELVEAMRNRGTGPQDDDLNLLQMTSQAVDIAMFGRMLTKGTAGETNRADEKGKGKGKKKGESLVEFCKEAAVQVAHAISVHEVAVEDDFFTAVDDLNRGEEDRGSAHMGETEFGAGVFYSYLCVHRDLLVENLQGDEDLAGRALKALVESAAKVAPSGKQNSFGSRARADYILVEKGEEQPRSLAVAFLEPVRKADYLMEAVKALRKTRAQMDKVYGQCSADEKEMCRPEEKGTLQEIMDFVAEA
jgi:CRISPR system Cascade subunit CasC